MDGWNTEPSFRTHGRARHGNTAEDNDGNDRRGSLVDPLESAGHGP